MFTNLLVLSLALIQPGTSTHTYNATCVLSVAKIPEIQKCQIVENRNSDGSLNWRNIYARAYWVRSWFGPSGLINKDSIRTNSYKWEYRANRQGYSGVSPNLNVHNITWD